MEWEGHFLSLDDREKLARILEQGKELLEQYEKSDREGRSKLLATMLGFLPTLVQETEEQLEYGKPANALTLALLMLAIGRAFDHLPTKGNAFKTLGKVYLRLEQYKEVLESYEQAQTLMREMGDERGEIEVLGGLEKFYWVLALRQRKLNYHRESISLYRRALGIARQLGNHLSECVFLYEMGSAYLLSGRKEEAFTSLEQALELAKRLGERQLEGGILNEMGKAYREMEKLEEALGMHDEALVIAREVSDLKLERDAVVETGITFSHIGKFPAALEHLQTGFKICQQLDDPACGSATLHHISLVYDQLGQLDDALEFSLQALDVLQVIEDKALESDILHTTGLLYGKLWRFAEALAHLERALKTRRDLGDSQGESRTLTQIGETYRLMKKPRKAFEVLEQAIKLDPDCHFGWLYMGRCLEELGRREEAITSYRRVLRIDPEHRFAREQIKRLGILIK